MLILCDTHIYFWWVTGDQKLPMAARQALEATVNQILVSAVVPWELATKSRLGKWPAARAALDEIDRVIDEKGLRRLPITLAHARVAGLLPGQHRDPFDRMLAAQAKAEGVTLATVDPVFHDFGVNVLS